MLRICRLRELAKNHELRQATATVLPSPGAQCCMEKGSQVCAEDEWNFVTGRLAATQTAHRLCEMSTLLRCARRERTFAQLYSCAIARSMLAIRTGGALQVERALWLGFTGQAMCMRQNNEVSTAYSVKCFSIQPCEALVNRFDVDSAVPDSFCCWTTWCSKAMWMTGIERQPKQQKVAIVGVE